MTILAKIRKTGRLLTLRAYSYGYVDCCGNFYHRKHVKLVEVLQ